MFSLNSKIKFSQLINQWEGFKKNPTSIELALDLSSNAWHLTDWVGKEFFGATGRQALGDFREKLYPHCESLRIMHDIANYSKHAELSRPKAQLKEVKKHIGPYSRVFARQFNQTYLKIEMLDGTVLHFEDEIEKVINFWIDYFKNQLGIEI